MERHPWSNNQMRKLGECIRDDQLPRGSTPTYDDVMLYFNDYAEATQRELLALDWKSLLGGRRTDITSRSKSVDTLRQKLQRDHATPLQNVQDVAGVRFEAEMSLTEQDAVVTAIVGKFDHNPHECIHDLRNDPHSGYRAVHIWLKKPARVEVQVRTHLQGRWANMYEAAADVLGRDIRYGALPAETADKRQVENLHTLSQEIKELEELSNEAFLLALEMEEFPPGNEASNLESGRIQLQRLREDLKDRESRVISDCDTLRIDFEQRRRPGGGR